MKNLLFCLTTSVNSAYLDKCYNCKPTKCFILSLSENWENIGLPLIEGSWSKSATAVTERTASAFSGNIIDISHKLESISVHKSLDTIKSSSIINSFTSDSLFLKAALDLSIISSNFVPGLIARLEWMVVSPIFTGDILVGLSKRTLGFSESLVW